MKKLIVLIFMFITVMGMTADRNLSISTGYTMLNRFSLDASDTISVSDTVVFNINNLQKYAQNQVFTVALEDVSGDPNVTITAYGKVTASADWVAIGSAITWTSDSNDGSITSTSPINYNYLKVEFISNATAQKTKILTFEVKTSNAFDVPANSGTFTISRATEGTVTVTTKDNDANAATVYRAGGTGALTIGASTGTTAITSSDWAIGTTGIMTGIGAITADGLITATGGLTVATRPTVYWAAGGAVALATAGTDAAATDGGRFWVELNIPYNSTITGLSYLIGSVGGTDSVVVQLCNSSGVEVATSRAVGGAAALVGTAANFQNVAFTAPYSAVAGRYFAVVQFNGTTAKLRTYPIPGSKFIGNTAAGVWGTKANITPGTTFVADKAPIMFTY